MFCCLYLLNSATNIPGFEEKSCFKACKHYSGSKGGCSIMDIVESPLTKNKFGWMIHLNIQFPKDDSIQLGSLDSAICLVHPAEQDIWIVKTNKTEKPTYKLFILKKLIEFEDLDNLNRHIQMKGYDGRKIVDTDFKV